MMNLFKNGNLEIADKFGVNVPITSHENFINGVYSSVDLATAHGLDLLYSEDGIIPTCKLGCCQCCRYHILMNIAEAHTLAQYVKREFSTDQINELMIRTQQWHEWDNSRPGRYPSANADGRTNFSNYDHYCPLLVNGSCSAYPVRPVVCRTHFVCSDPLSCRAANNPESKEEAPVVLASVVTATSSFSMAIRNYIENQGLDFSRSIMLLPHGLAMEMDWIFKLDI
jgi:Fe-S-cluster containining protein